MNEKAFRIKDLVVHYEKVEAIKGVSLELEEGEIVTLIGSNGAGKTTILRAVSGLKEPTSGEIWYRGRRIDRRAPADIVKAGIALVPEGRRLFPWLTVAENLNLGAFLRKDKQEVKRDWEKVFHYFPVLGQRLRQRAKTLSGGEQQMLAIGRALMAKPRLLLLDEPSLGLAPLIIKGIVRVIKDINEGGVSIVLVEQNARMALGLADKGYVLETGSITLEGSAKELENDENVKRAYLGV